MVIRNRFGARLSILFIALFSDGVFATCKSCGDVAKYGAQTSKEIAGNTKSVVTASGDIAGGFASMLNQSVRNGENIVSAIQALGAVVDVQNFNAASARSQMKTMAAKSDLQVEKSKMQAEVNMHAAETYGAENIPPSLCRGYRNAELRKETKRVAIEELKKFRAQQQKWRRSPSDHKKILWASPVQVSGSEFSELNASIAMEKAAVLSGERTFSQSPDEILAMSETSHGNYLDEARAAYATWARSSVVTSDLAKQIAKRTKPEGDDGHQSLYGEIVSEVDAGMSADIPSTVRASKATLLRDISRKELLSIRVKLEQLEVMNSSNRAKSAMVGQLAAEEADRLESVVGHSRLERRVSD